jgi:hypothetical protein
MSYVKYNESLYRTGFRPYGTTDPARAATLGGAIDHSWQQFGPWTLRGGGQNVFTPGGGWSLHGLGALGIVPDQSVAVYRGKWTSTYTMGASDVIAAVASAINQDGRLAVRNVSSDAGWTQADVIVGPLFPGAFNVTLQVQVTNGEGFNQPSDIASIVDHFVGQVTGSMPVGSSVPSVQVPSGGGSAQQTGQPPGPGAPCIMYDPNNPYCSQVPATDWSAWLQQNALWLGLGLVGLLIVPRLL